MVNDSTPLVTVFIILYNVIFRKMVPSVNELKNKKTKKKQEFHQEYFCFLDEQFYYDQ